MYTIIFMCLTYYTNKSFAKIINASVNITQAKPNWRQPKIPLASKKIGKPPFRQSQEPWSCLNLPLILWYNCATILSPFGSEKWMKRWVKWSEIRTVCVLVRVKERSDKSRGRIKTKNVMTYFDGYTNKEETNKKIIRNVFKKGDQVSMINIIFANYVNIFENYLNAIFH